MTQEEQSKLEEMSLRTGATFTKPLSTVIIWILNAVKTNKRYFETSFKLGDEEELEVVRQFFHAAFYDRSRWYIPIFLIIMCSLAFDLCFAIPFGSQIVSCPSLPYNLNLQAYGLILDAFGAVFIALGLFRGPEGVLQDTPMRGGGGGTYGGAPPYIRPGPLSSTVRNTVDGLYGTAYLFIGFTIQFIAVSNIL